MFSSIYNTFNGAFNSSSAPPSTPSTPPVSELESSSPSSSQPTTTLSEDPRISAEEIDILSEHILASSAFYRKLVDKKKHSPERLLKIRQAAMKDNPPKEPTPEECCGEACGLECVTTVW